MISFAGGLPAPELFDASGLRAAFTAALADEAYGRTLQYSTTEGDPALRAAVARRMTARGLATEADDILITSGSQQALTLIAAVLLEPGDQIAIDFAREHLPRTRGQRPGERAATGTDFQEHLVSRRRGRADDFVNPGRLEEVLPKSLAGSIHPPVSASPCQ